MQTENDAQSALAAPQMNRTEVLLRAAYDMMKQQRDTTEVLNVLGLEAFYDGTNCDGYCLLEDIEIERESDPDFDKTDRKEILLGAVHDILKQQHGRSDVVSCLDAEAFYDGTNCDGRCLLMDIEVELELDH